MQGYNIIVVFDERRERVLLCRRRKEPYKGLLNFVGGKIEPGEEGLAAAYRGSLWFILAALAWRHSGPR